MTTDQQVTIHAWAHLFGEPYQGPDSDGCPCPQCFDGGTVKRDGEPWRRSSDGKTLEQIRDERRAKGWGS